MTKTKESMQAVAIDEFGGLDTLKPRTLPVPQPGPDEVLIRVESAGVGVWDPFEREGHFAEMFDSQPEFPYVLGSDGAGTIAAVGKDVRDLQPGDRVFALSLANPKGGFYAEYAAVAARNVSRIPEQVPTLQAGAMAVDAITALRGLDDVLALKPGETLLVFGASGGVGHLAVQLARRMGARVFAVASGEDGVELTRRLGADAAVDGHAAGVAAAAREFAPDGLDAALITAGGEGVEQVLTTVRDGGRVAYPNGVSPPPKGRAALEVRSYDGEPGADALAKLNRLIGSEPFEVHVARSFPLAEAAEAQRALEGHYLGKLALRPVR